MENGITYVGVDAHKKDLVVAMLVGDQTTPVTWQVVNEPHAVRRFVRKLEREAPGPVRMCYEAGPGGYALQRQVTTPRVRCQVIAPALIPRKPGEHIKTNRRDARQAVGVAARRVVDRCVRRRSRRKRSVTWSRAMMHGRRALAIARVTAAPCLHYPGAPTRAHRQWIARPRGPSPPSALPLRIIRWR
jgi:hypothetical protein